MRTTEPFDFVADSGVKEAWSGLVVDDLYPVLPLQEGACECRGQAFHL